MAEKNIRNAIEAILFASGDSVPVSRIAAALELTESQAKSEIETLMKEYEEANRGITIIRLDGSYQMTSVEEYAPEIRTVMDLRRNTPLSQAALEVLAVIAYNQPVTKAFVEQVRGVGRLELPGRPLVYGTTENFLRCFSISDLSELPALPESEKPDSDADEGDDSQLSIFSSEEEDKSEIDEKADAPLDAMIAATPEEIIEEAAK